MYCKCNNRNILVTNEDEIEDELGHFKYNYKNILVANEDEVGF